MSDESEELAGGSAGRGFHVGGAGRDAGGDLPLKVLWIAATVFWTIGIVAWAFVIKEFILG